jgi:SPP1 gp7 family putative phage head morphogenesis protein
MTNVLPLDGALASLSAHAAEELLEALRVPVEKAFDPLSPKGYLRIVAQVRRALQGATAEGEAAAVAAALRTLDVDWGNLSEVARERVLEGAREAIRSTVVAQSLPAVRETFRIVGPGIVGETRANAIRRFGLNVAVNLTQRDRAAERYVRTSTANFIRDQYGRRADELASTAREIVARGLEEGAGRDAIASRLAAGLGDRVMRDRAYWQVVAGQFTNAARTFSQINAYQDAGIQSYVFEAVLDEVTTEQCRYFHGRTFPVAGAAALRDRLTNLSDPDAVYDANPWVRTGRDEEGNRIIYIERGGAREVVAQIDRTGVGSRDDVGSFSRGMSSEQLLGAGVPFPPLHANCRSTIVPNV